MARRYRHYRKRESNLLEQVVPLVILIFMVLIWQWQTNDSNALIYIAVIGAVVLGAAIYLSIRKYLQTQRRLRALTIAAIDTMDPLEFERYVATLLKHQGFADIRLTEKYDYGVDIIARKDSVTWGIQVKRHSNLVKAEAVRQVVTGLIRYNCTRSMVVTNNVFSRPAKILAADNNCVLISREELSDWIVQFQNSQN